MKEKIESFLHKPWYFLSIISMSLIIWSLKYYVSDSMILTTTFLLYIPLALTFFLVSYYFDNSIYTVPITLSLLFSIGITNMNSDTIYHLGVAIIPISLILLGIVVHLIKYKIRFKFKTLSIGLTLASISFLIPLIYRPYSFDFFFLSLLGLLYLLIYTFYSLTIKKNSIDYLFKSLLWISVLLATQLTVIIAHFIFSNPTIKEGFNNLKYLNVDSPGWGNINDLTIHLVLYASSIIYYLKRNPKSILPLVLFGWFFIATFLSFSRGSMITITLLGILIVIQTLTQGNKNQVYSLIGIGSFLLLFLIFKFSFFVKTFNDFLESLDGGLDKMLTGRVQLWDHAVKTFQSYPLFGGGWMSDIFILNPGQNRPMVYHSTFFQVLAAGGIFGVLILIYHFYEVTKLFKKSKLNRAKYAILTTYLITQLHGLVDNTQYMIYYMTSVIVIFSVLENSSIEDNNTLKFDTNIV